MLKVCGKYCTHVSWKFSKLSNSGISSNWYITDKATTRNTQLTFGPLCECQRFLT